MNRLLMKFSLIFSLSLFISLSIPQALAFQESDCICDNGLEVFTKRVESDLLKCVYNGEVSEAYSVPHLTVEVWKWKGKEGFLRYKEELREEYKGLSDYSAHTIIFEDYVIEDDRASLIYRAEGIVTPDIRNARRTIFYKDHHVTFYGQDFRIPVNDIFERTEECMKKAIDNEPLPVEPGFWRYAISIFLIISAVFILNDTRHGKKK